MQQRESQHDNDDDHCHYDFDPSLISIDEKNDIITLSNNNNNNKPIQFISFNNNSMDDIDSLYTTKSTDESTIIAIPSSCSKINFVNINDNNNVIMKDIKTNEYDNNDNIFWNIMTKKRSYFWNHREQQQHQQQQRQPTSSATTTITTLWTQKKKLCMVSLLCFIVTMMLIITLLTSFAFMKLNNNKKQTTNNNNNNIDMSPSSSVSPSTATSLNDIIASPSGIVSIVPTVQRAATSVPYYTTTFQPTSLSTILVVQSTEAPTTISPSTIPSNMPSYYPSHIPITISPTISTSNVPSFLPTYYPSSIPSYVPSKIPSTTSLPTILPTHIPTITTILLPTIMPTIYNTNNTIHNITFYVMVSSIIPDIPGQITILNPLYDISNDAEFVIHLGNAIDHHYYDDITLSKKKSKKSDIVCQLQDYNNVASILQLSPVPVFVLPGDNDWNECSNPDDGYTYWNLEFINFEKMYWNNTKMKIIRPSNYPMNFALLQKNILYIGLDMLFNNNGEISFNAWKLRDAALWVNKLIKNYNVSSNELYPQNGKRIVLFSNVEPTSYHDPFFQPIRRFIQNELMNTIPIFYIHTSVNDDKNDHFLNGSPTTSYEYNYLGQSSWVRIMIQMNHSMQKQWNIMSINPNLHVTDMKEILIQK